MFAVMCEYYLALVLACCTLSVGLMLLQNEGWGWWWMSGDSVSFLHPFFLFLTSFPVVLSPYPVLVRGCPAKKLQGKLNSWTGVMFKI